MEVASAQTLERESERFFEDLTAYYPRLLLRLIGRLRFRLPDLERCYLLDFKRCVMEAASRDDEWDSA